MTTSFVAEKKENTWRVREAPQEEAPQGEEKVQWIAWRETSKRLHSEQTLRLSNYDRAVYFPGHVKLYAFAAAKSMESVKQRLANFPNFAYFASETLKPEAVWAACQRKGHRAPRRVKSSVLMPPPAIPDGVIVLPLIDKTSARIIVAREVKDNQHPFRQAQKETKIFRDENTKGTEIFIIARQVDNDIYYAFAAAKTLKAAKRRLIARPNYVNLLNFYPAPMAFHELTLPMVRKAVRRFGWCGEYYRLDTQLDMPTLAEEDYLTKNPSAKVFAFAAACSTDDASADMQARLTQTALARLERCPNHVYATVEKDIVDTSAIVAGFVNKGCRGRKPHKPRPIKTMWSQAKERSAWFQACVDQKAVNTSTWIDEKGTETIVHWAIENETVLWYGAAKKRPKHNNDDEDEEEHNEDEEERHKDKRKRKELTSEKLSEIAWGRFCHRPGVYAISSFDKKHHEKIVSEGAPFILQSYSSAPLFGEMRFDDFY